MIKFIKLDEKDGQRKFNCESCRRPIRHRGFCLACNMKRLREQEMVEHMKPTRDKVTCQKCGFEALYQFLRCPECGTIDEKKGEKAEEFVSRNVLAVKKLNFPYSSVRASQDTLIADVQNAVKNKRHLIADAPTGLGKTIAALFPAVEYALEHDMTVFFLTSRLSQHKMAIETLQGMGTIIVTDIIGKKWLCSHDVQDMDSSMFSNFCYAMLKDNMCKYYKNFREKGIITSVAQCMISTIGKKPHHSEDVKKLTSHKFCAYELLMEMAKSSDVVVGDYFHIFSANGKKFFRRMNKMLNNSILIVDEAHNLPGRIRKDLSSKISTRTIDFAKKENQKFGLGVDKYIGYLEDAISSVAKKKLLTDTESFIEKESLIGAIEKFCSFNDIILLFAAAGEKVFEHDRSRSFTDKLATFLGSWKGEDYGYARIISRERYMGKDHISIFYNCMDPSLVSKPIISESYSTILMSGTLSPMQMYRDLLDLEENRTDMKTYSSPFPKENRLNLITTEVTTRYRKRNPENYAKIARTVALCTDAIKGNVAVFFPSYEIMKTIYSLLNENTKKPILMEQQDMTKEERKNLQEEFASQHEKGAILFGVLAGSFSEGIDLPGDKLNGVVIVGLPLEKPTLMVNALIDYYNQRFKKGREYGYIYPAIIKVMQASGRCIRTEKDIGVCVFADERFIWENYRCIFPKNWDFIVTERPELEIKKFFEKVQE